MYVSKPPARCVSLLVTTATVASMAACLTGCSTSGKGCRGTETRARELAAQPILASHPARASAPANYPRTTTGCDDDSSGAPWIHADRLYAFPGTRAEVARHYLAAAPAAGWRLEEDPAPYAAPASVEGVCFAKGSKGHTMLLTVDFRLAAYSPAPVLNEGIGYEVSVGSQPGSGSAHCWQ